MSFERLTLAAMVAVAASGCAPGDGATGVEPGLVEAALQSNLGKVSGGGHYAIAGTVAQFAFSGHQTSADESARGQFHHRLEFGGAFLEFFGVFTCLSIDAAEGRAWVGGVVTVNNSTLEPFASGDIYQPGRDIWFRVLDVGPPSRGVDRTTFTGFEGGAGIITSREYCDTRPWPANNDRTNPLTTGNLNVMP